jgi:hypothetical protein
MLGRKNYTLDELANGKDAIAQQLAAYGNLVEALAAATSDHGAGAQVRPAPPARVSMRNPDR